MNPYRHDIFLQGMLEKSERFIGLHEEVEGLLARISGDRPAAISMVGPWGIGKSFSLQFLADPRGAQRSFKELIGLRFRAEPERLCFVPVDLEQPLPAEQATHGFLELLYDLLLAKLSELFEVDDVRLIPIADLPATFQRSLPELRDQIRRALRQASESAEADELRERFETTLGSVLPIRLIKLLQRLDAWNIRVVFLIDNFDTIAAQLDLDSFDHLRAILSSASMVITTRQALSKIVSDAAQSSPFFNLLEKMNLLRLNFLATEEAQRLITDPPTWFDATAHFHFSKTDVEFILELTGNHPDIIRASCEYLYTWARRNESTNMADILPVTQRPYIRALLRPLFADSFAVLWRRLDDEERQTLFDIAQGKVSAIGVDYLPPPTTLNKLIERGYVVYDKGQYCLFAGLFHDYVIDQGAGPVPAQTPVLTTALTDLEAKLLDLLKAQPGEIVDRDHIIAALYDVKLRKSDPTRMTYYSRLDALLFRLRGKLTNEPLLIENIRGQGYRLVWTK